MKRKEKRKIKLLLMMIYSIMSHQMKSKDYYCFDAMRATEM